MHYISIDWVPAAIAISAGALIVGLVRAIAWWGARNAARRTERNIERVLNQHHDEGL